MRKDKIWIDPFSGFNSPAHITNDLNPETPTQYHLDAEEFVVRIDGFDCVLFDPPYSPRQISESYKSFGLEVTMKTTQNALLYARVRNAIVLKQPYGGISISFGWNSTGFGKSRGYEKIEVMLVNHGAAHNDTIVVVERKIGD